MFCSIYRSTLRDQTYLYIEKKDDFSRLPETLLNTFGKPHFVMILNLDERDHLASADIDQVRQQLKQSGYYLQLPPTVESLLNPCLCPKNNVTTTDVK